MTPAFYKDAKGNPAFELSACVYMDVLGFAESQKESLKHGRGLAEFKNFYAAHSSALAWLDESEFDPSERTWHVKIFTDNIVIGLPLRGIITSR